MLLKGLELRGFKSFVERVKLEFGPGITCIVGPNGSGKSNIADAIFWVLGEQSAKTLRSTRMDDVIFAGSAKRRPVGLAEVTLFLDNTRGILPLDYSEIAVTRRVFRSGEGEYLLNRSPCRLRDIQELFLEGGFGRSALTIVGQGRLEDILTARGEERRLLLEEVLGLARLRWRKKEAEQKLNIVEQDLTRLSDVLNELDRQSLPLAKEAEMARRYQKLKKGLGLIELLLSTAKLQELQERQQSKRQYIEALSKKAVEAQNRGRELATQSEKIETELATLRSRLREKEEELSRLQKDIEAERGQVNVLRERQGFYRLKQEEVIKERERLLKERSRIEEEKKALLERQVNLMAEKQALQEALAVAQGSKAELMQKRQAVVERTEQLRTELYDVLHNMAGLKNDIVRLEEQQKAQKKEFLAVESEKIRLTAAKDKIRQQLQLAREEATATETALQHLAREKINLEEELTSASDSLESIELQLKVLREQQQQALNQLDWLRQAEADYRGFGDGVKLILSGVKAGSPELKGILGVLVEQLRVPPGLEKAIEVALGGALTYVLVESAVDAGRAIAYLKQGRGHATFLPLEWLEGRTWPTVYAWCLAERGVLGIAAQLVQVKEQFRPALSYFLGQTLVVEDIERAIAIARRLRPPLRLVTLEGDLIQPKGPISGGSKSGQRGFLSRRQEVSRLEIETSQTAAKLKELELAGKKLKEVMSDRKKRLLVLEREEAEKRGRLKAVLLRLSELREEKARLEAELTTLGTEVALAGVDDGEWEDLYHEYNSQLSALQDEEKRLQDSLAAAREEMLQLDREIQFSQQRLDDIQAQEVKLVGRVQRIEVELRALEQRYLETAEKLKELASELEKVIEQLALLTEKTQIGVLEIEERERYYRVVQEALADEYKKEAALLQFKRELIHKENALNQETLTLTQQLKEAEVMLAHLEAAIANLLQEMEARHGPHWQEVAARPYFRARRRAVTTRERIEARLADMDDVNPGALNEYVRLRSRYEELAGQKADLEKGRLALEEVIRECERLMADRIQAGFQEVRAHFSALFQELFGGGTADLHLTGNSILEAGIEILACPPGKKLQHLSLLSGGEKALTAITFIFALLKFRPSLFCVFDEIDTALDEANVERFARLLQKFSSTTQFIVISHRQGTMAAADVLYGITMEEAGVSSLVSVKLDRLPA